MLNPDTYLPKGKYEHQQWAAGKADSVLKVLKVRTVEVSEAERQRILAERDLGVLDRWLARALTAASTSEVLAEG